MTDHENLELDVDPYRATDPAGDRVVPFRSVLDYYQQRFWLVAEHQRKPDAWDRSKQRKYVDRLRESRSGSHPPGIFVTYQLMPWSPVFLNDGLQRLTTLNSLVANPASFGMDERGVSDLLQQNITVQHRLYATHEDAMRDFQLINYGTRLTPHEMCNGYLTYMDDYEAIWGPIISDIEKSVDASWHRVGINGKQLNRETQHKMKRHLLSLIHRFICEVKEPKKYNDVGQRDIDLDNQAMMIEVLLRDQLLFIGQEEFQRKARSLQTLIENSTAMIEAARDEVLEPGVALVTLVHRWILDFAVWARHNRVPIARQEEFLRTLLRETQGKNEWRGPGTDKVQFGFAHLGVLAKVAGWAEMDDLVERSRRRRSTRRSRPGYQDGHVEPFSQVGDGPTIKEPASRNMARGAQPIQ